MRGQRARSLRVSKGDVVMARHGGGPRMHVEDVVDGAVRVVWYDNYLRVHREEHPITAVKRVERAYARND